MSSLRFTDKTGHLLKTPRFKELTNESFFTAAEESARANLPHKNVSSQVSGRAVVLTIKDREGNLKEVLQWETQDDTWGFESEVYAEDLAAAKDALLDAAIQSIFTSEYEIIRERGLD